MLVVVGLGVMVHRRQERNPSPVGDGWLRSPRRRVEFAMAHPIFISVAVISVSMLPWVAYMYASEHSAAEALKVFLAVVIPGSTVLAVAVKRRANS